jgi:signal transduction histidine kinase
VINSYKEELKRRGLNLQFDKPKQKLPQVKVDVEKIRLAIQNLLDNAVRYSPAGSKITIALSEQDGQIEFRIQDQGIGIPEDQHSRVFEKFFRGANAARMETQGSGLGLFIAKNIIEAHGGRIWFESEQDKGATFHFILPAKERTGGFA